jgi:hypothetical protein
MINVEPCMYKLGKLAAREVAKGLDKDREEVLLNVIYEDAQTPIIPPKDCFIPVSDFTVGYADQLFEICPNPNEREKQMHKSFLTKAKNIVNVAVFQTYKPSNECSVESMYD